MHGLFWEAPGTAAGGVQVLLLLADDDGKIFGIKVLCNNHLDGLMGPGL
jgi:hypothetical protein